MARSENANTVPLGRPNRLADGSNKAAAPGPAGVWKRTDGDTTHSNPPPVNEHHRKDNFWERRAARKEAECGKTHTTKGKTKKRRHVVEASSQPPDRRPHPHRQAQPSHDVGPAHHTRDTISTAALNPDLQHFRPFPFPPAPPPSPPPGAAATMGTKRMSNGEAKHPPRSEIRVSARYLTQAFIDKKLQPPWSEVLGSVQERSMYEAREDSVRLQGVTWLDHVRRALELPVRTFATACVYYHLVRLAHPGLLHGSDPNVQATVADACAASLLTACKVEDTLKKSRDVLAAAYNLKAPAQEQLGTDDPVFDGPVKHVIVLERMVLEAGGFDFRSKQPHSLMVRIIKFLSLPEGNEEERKTVSKTAFTILTDMYRTFAPLKQTAAAMALASLELAAHLYATTTSNNTSAVRDALQAYDVSFFSLSREEIMETLLDLLDLYTHHTNGTAIGPIYSLDDFLRIRLAMNKECAESNLPRYTTKSPDAAAPPANGSTSRVANGHPTPVSPPSPDPQSQFHNTNNAGLQPRSNNPEDQQQQIQQQQPGQQQQQQQQQQPVQTTRFMLNPQRAADEHAIVQTFFAEEWEEYEEEIEVPIPQPTPHNHAHSSHHPRSHLHPRAREPPSGPAAAGSGGGGAGAAGSPLYPPRARDERERERERLRDREREVQRELRERERERERERDRDRERERERDHRRYDDRERGRYEDKRDRRYEDDRRRRDDRR